MLTRSQHCIRKTLETDEGWPKLFIRRETFLVEDVAAGSSTLKLGVLSSEPFSTSKGFVRTFLLLCPGCVGRSNLLTSGTEWPLGKGVGLVHVTVIAVDRWHSPRLIIVSSRGRTAPLPLLLLRAVSSGPSYRIMGLFPCLAANGNQEVPTWNLTIVVALHQTNPLLCKVFISAWWGPDVATTSQDVKLVLSFLGLLCHDIRPHVKIVMSTSKLLFQTWIISFISEINVKINE